MSFSFSFNLISVKDLSNSIRLVDGTSPYEGRVEINVNGVWGSICARKWDKPLNGTPLNGNVVCKQMGFGPSINTASVSFGNGNGPVFLSNVNCNGRETTVLECGHVEADMSECEGDNRNDVGVRCSKPAGITKGSRRHLILSIFQIMLHVNRCIGPFGIPCLLVHKK